MSRDNDFEGLLRDDDEIVYRPGPPAAYEDDVGERPERFALHDAADPQAARQILADLTAALNGRPHLLFPSTAAGLTSSELDAEIAVLMQRLDEGR